jgi:protein SCO1/2
LILASILVLPAITYFYVTQGSNNFIKLEVIGHEGHQIPDFSFINQNNEVVINDSFKGNIYITNFFFTSCPTICPVMTKNMAYVQDKLSTFPNIKFLSHTVDPLNDTPERMLNYVNELKVKNVNINLSNWDFVTGEKEELYKIAQSYFVNVSMDSLAPGGFLHSEYFVLIDKEGRVRSGIDKNNNVVGVYDGTNDAQMKDLVNDVNVLMAEYKKPKKEDEE